MAFYFFYCYLQIKIIVLTSSRTFTSIIFFSLSFGKEVKDAFALLKQEVKMFQIKANNKLCLR